MTLHAALGASSCYRWWACPGSVRLAASAPPTPSSRFALEGTAAHAVLAWCLTDGGKATPGGFRAGDEAVGRPLSTFVTDPAELAEMLAAGVTEVTAEMAEGVQVHIDYVIKQLHNRMLLQVEQRIDLAPLHPPAIFGSDPKDPAAPRVAMFGTADTILFDLDSGLLETVDFKYGRGKFVAAEGNPQLRYYGIGAWLDATAKKRPVRAIRNTIVQPRAGGEPIRAETLDPMELYDWHTELMAAAARTQEPGAPLVAGDHCDWCPASGTCPAYRAAALDVAKADFAALPAVTVPAAAELSQADLLRILDGADLLEQWIGSVRSHAKHLLDTGVALPGWKLAERVGHRRWKEETLVLGNVATILNKPVPWVSEQAYNEPDLKSPAQMEKLLTKAQRESPAFKALWHKPVTGSTMVRDSAAQPAIAPKIASDFTAVSAAKSLPEEELDLLG